MKSFVGSKILTIKIVLTLPDAVTAERALKEVVSVLRTLNPNDLANKKQGLDGLTDIWVQNHQELVILRDVGLYAPITEKASTYARGTTLGRTLGWIESRLYVVDKFTEDILDMRDNDLRLPEPIQ